MAAYVKITNFAVKDGLLSGNPSKIVSGTEIDAELNAIALSSSQNLTAITDAQTATAASASAAATSATNAATSATNASTSATTATTQASNASTSATNAASSATSASTSASTATTQASNASTSATNAASSASAAATSETNAATSASTASTQASNASTSATNAANSATTATTQATNAATSATNAATSATTADTVVQSVAIKWTFSTTTTMADPGSGIIRFNNATPSSVTAIAVDDNNSSAQDISAYVIAWDDSTSTNKGTLTIKQGTSLAIYTITTLTDNVGWTELAVTYVSGSGTFSDATAVYATFLRTGDKGATGTGDALVANPLSQFAATTSAQLAGVVSDETGSGALVFATSPTLVTPALGTPSSVTLTNATGLPQAGTVGLTTADSPQFAALNIGHATDTTLTRVSAGKLAQDGVTLADLGINNFTGGQNEARGSVAMHATTMDLWAQPNIIDGTSTAATVTAIANAPQAGARRVFYPVAASVITNGATFAVDGAANHTAAAGDKWEFEAITTSTYKVHVTKKDGTAVVAAGGGAWVWLSTVTASASATVDIETTFDSTYDVYVIVGTNISTSNDGAQFAAQMKIGGSYLTTVTYQWAILINVTNAPGVDAATDFNTDDIKLSQSTGNVSGETAGLTMRVYNPASTSKQKIIDFEMPVINASGNPVLQRGVGKNSGTGALTGIRIKVITGTLSGTFRLYGIKNS